MSKQNRLHTNRAKHARRRGMALILILGMLAITIAVSYAMMRSQVQTTLLQVNSQTNGMARQAAEAGLNRAIRKMSVDDWGGVGSTSTGSVSSQSSYSVTFTAGDASLATTDPNYAEYPYRVTVTSTGTAWSSGDSTLSTTYTMTAVLQLVRRALNTSSTPTQWATMNGYTCYQWNSGATLNVNMDLPIQIQGNTCLMGKLRFARQYPNDSTSRQRYFTDLKLMKDETGVDYRPFTGGVALGAGRQDASTAGELTSWLGLTVTNPTTTTGDPWAYVNAPATYQLYEGGPTYTVGNLYTTYGATPTGQVITPNVLTNPLGVYLTGNDITLNAGTKFTGVLFSDADKDVILDGANTQLNGVSLTLDGSSLDYQIPVLMESDKLVVKNNVATSVQGLVICWKKFELLSGTQNTVFHLQGRLFADEFDLNKRDEWTSMSQWSEQHALFDAQDGLLGGIRYFPTWLDLSIFDLQAPPKIVFQPKTNTSYHWPNWSLPIYTTAAGDAGLRWNVVSWKDGL